jgi:hypothetical protein
MKLQMSEMVRHGYASNSKQNRMDQPIPWEQNKQGSEKACEPEKGALHHGNKGAHVVGSE